MFLVGLWQKEAKILFLGPDKAGKKNLLHMLRDEVDAVVYFFNAYDSVYESERELNALLSDVSLANIPFLILVGAEPVNEFRNINIFYNRDDDSENVLKSWWHLNGLTTGKGKVNLAPNVRPFEVFMCDNDDRMGYGDGFKWLSQYIR